jgi:hypothetical protein
MRRAMFCGACIATILITSIAHAEPTTAPSTESADKPLDQSTLDRQFKESLTGATLVGKFDDDARPDAVPHEERYTFQSVRKIPFTDRWLITAHVNFGSRDATIPLTIPVKWAGDTPVISVTDMSIPRMGTYTARVMIYRDHYAGTWSGATHGGHMWGRIERTPTTGATTQPAP